MPKLNRALILGAMLAAMNLAGMTAVAHAHATEHTIKPYAGPPLEPHAGESDRHRQVPSQQQTATDAALRLLARERFSIPSATPAQVPAPVPPEPSGQPGWLLASLGVLAAALALSGGLAVLTVKRASRKARLGQAP
jgi:hypothetical protein